MNVFRALQSTCFGEGRWRAGVALAELALYDQLSLELEGGDFAVDVDLALVVLIQLIDPKAIFLCIDNREELMPKAYELRGIDEALEDRGLDSLAVVLADAGYLAEAFSSRGCRRGDIIGDEDIH